MAKSHIIAFDRPSSCIALYRHMVAHCYKYLPNPDMILDVSKISNHNKYMIWLVDTRTGHHQLGQFYSNASLRPKVPYRRPDGVAE